MITITTTMRKHSCSPQPGLRLRATTIRDVSVIRPSQTTPCALRLTKSQGHTNEIITRGRLRTRSDLASHLCLVLLALSVLLGTVRAASDAPTNDAMRLENILSKAEKLVSTLCPVGLDELISTLRAYREWRVLTEKSWVCNHCSFENQPQALPNEPGFYGLHFEEAPNCEYCQHADERLRARGHRCEDCAVPSNVMLCPTCLGNGHRPAGDLVIPIKAGFGSDCPTCIAEVIQDFLPCAACSGTGSLCRPVWEEFLEWRRQEEIE